MGWVARYAGEVGQALRGRGIVTARTSSLLGVEGRLKKNSGARRCCVGKEVRLLDGGGGQNYPRR